jgi:hypothetical protein
MPKREEPQTTRNNDGKVTEDARFASMAYDPRFQRFPKAKAKVEIDDRFKGKTRIFTCPKYVAPTYLTDLSND